MALKIQKAQLLDAERVALLQTQIWQEMSEQLLPKTFLKTVDTHKVADHFTRKKHEAKTEQYIARADSKPVGYMVFSATSSYDPAANTGEIRSLSMLGAYRRHGYGTQMAHFALERLWALGCKRVVARVLAQDADTIAFYKQLGFTVYDSGATMPIGNEHYPALLLELMKPKSEAAPPVRQATSSDKDAVLRLFTQLEQEPIPNHAKLEALFDHVLSNKNHYLLVAEQDGAVAALCIMLIVTGDAEDQSFALIEALVADKRLRHQGYGNAVLQQAVQLATVKNCYKVMLLANHPQPELQPFYDKAGFSKINETAYVRNL